MNQRVAIGTVLSVAAAAGITAGAVIHAINGPSSEPTARPSSSTVTSLPATRSPRATTTAGTTTVPASVKSSTPSTPSASSKPSTAAATSRVTTSVAAPTSASKPKPATPISAASLVGPSEFAAAGVARLKVEQTGLGGPQYDMSACPAVDGPLDLSKRGVVWGRNMYSSGPAVGTYQLLADFRTTKDADQQVKFLNDWHDHCGTPDPAEPSQNFTMGKSHPESVPGVDQARWWDLTFTNEGKRRMETVAWTRKGNRVNIAVFNGLESDIRNTDMTALITGMVDKAS